MNQEIKKQWIEALRSGKYEQARGTLRTVTNSFCCLGVLCDLVDPSEWDNYSLLHNKIAHMNNVGLPSVEVFNKTGLTIKEATTLSDLNDDYNDFHCIANWIEENL